MNLHNIELPKPTKAYTDAVGTLAETERVIAKLAGDIDAANAKQDEIQASIRGLVQKRAELTRAVALGKAADADFDAIEAEIGALQATFDIQYERANLWEDLKDEMHSTLVAKRARVESARKAYFRAVLAENEDVMLERAREALAPLGALQRAAGLGVDTVGWWNKARPGQPGLMDDHLCQVVAQEFEQALQ